EVPFLVNFTQLAGLKKFGEDRINVVLEFDIVLFENDRVIPATDNRVGEFQGRVVLRHETLLGVVLGDRLIEQDSIDNFVNQVLVGLDLAVVNALWNAALIEVPGGGGVLESADDALGVLEALQRVEADFILPQDELQAEGIVR